MPVFKYKIPRKVHTPAPAFNVQLQADDEGLTGQIQGYPASDIEERFARALDRDERVSSYTFREAVIAGRNLPGQLEVDFMIQTGAIVKPVQVDGEFAHKGLSKKEEDAMKDELINKFLSKYGAARVQRIDGEKLSDQRKANDLVRDLL